MVFLKNNPFVRLLLPFIFGICLQYYFVINHKVIVAFIATSLLFILFAVYNLKLKYSLKFLYGILVSFFLIVSGVFLTKDTSNAFGKLKGNELVMTGKLLKPIKKAGVYSTTEILVTAIKDDDIWYDHKNKAIISFKNDSSVSLIKAGQSIIFKATVTNISERLNPFGFNYKQYLALKDINSKLYVESNNWQLISEPQKGLRYLALNLRKNLIQKLEDNGIVDENLAVLSALTFGYKDKLDEKIRRAYSGAGAMHVLAVSGLHVSIIYGLLEILFIWLRLFRKSKKVKAAIIIVGIWAYAFLTGLSPSVMRASVMFTFIVGGQLLNRKASIYNSLSASAFILLLISPKLLFNIGFQLSYTAVIGIVLLQPKIKNLFFFRYKVFNWAWQITAVSIAAQIATFPITTYHFHEFPTYFWLSNIVVTTVATMLICMSFLLIAFSSFVHIASFISFVTNKLISYNILFINAINDLPGHIISNININYLQVALVYCIMLTIGVWLIKKYYSFLMSALVLILLFGVVRILITHTIHNQSGVCMYHITKESAIHFVEQDKATWILSNSQDIKNIENTMVNANLFWHTKTNNHYRINNLLDTSLINTDFYCKNGFWKTQDRKGLIVHSNSYPPIIPLDTLKLDYIFVCGSPTFSLKEIPDKITYKKLIIDGSVPYWKARSFSNAGLGSKLYETKQKGAFIDIVKL